MKLKYLFTALAATMALAVGCKEDVIGDLAELQVSSSYVAIPVEGGSSDITVTATMDWTFAQLDEATAKWLTIDKTSGTVGETKVVFSAGEALNSRSAALKILVGGKTQFINVAQTLAGGVSLSTCKEVLDGPDGKTYQIEGTVTRIAESATYGNWYINDGTGEVYIYGTKNKAGETKKGALKDYGLEVGDVVKIEGPKTTYNGTVELVDVDILNITKSLLKVCNIDELQPVEAEGGIVSVDMIAKGGALAISCAEDWIAIASTEIKKAAPGDIDTTVVNFRVLPNEDDVRTAVVTAKSGTTEQTFEISQKSGLSAYQLPYEEKFNAGLGAWTINNVDVEAAKNKIVWTEDKTNGYMKATSGQKCVACAEIVSPLIDLGKVSAANLSFEHTHRYAGNLYEEFTLWVSGDNGTTWNQLLIPHYGPNTAWTWVNSGAISLNAYAGKQILVKFVYKSNANFYGTWEVKNVKVVEGNGAAMDSVAEITSLAWNKDVKTNFEATLTDAIVTYVNGSNCFIEDATGGMLLYKNGHGLVAGDKISGKVTGVMTFYGGFAEATDLNISAATKTPGQTVTPTTIAVDALMAGFNRYVSCMVKLADVTLSTALVSGGNRNSSLTQAGSNTVVSVYAKTKTVTVAKDATGDLVCYPCYNNGVDKPQVGIWEDAHFTAK